MKPASISTRRNLLQIILVAAILSLPFGTIGNQPFLRLDLRIKTFFLAGMALRIDESFLLLLLGLLAVALFSLLTLMLGRVWCGWFCPQTVLNDLTLLLASQLARPFASQRAAAAAYQIAAAVVSLVLPGFLLALFMPPSQVLQVLVNPGDNLLPSAVFSAVAILLFADLLLVRRAFCRSCCPYGRFQAVLMDRGTLTLTFDEGKRSACLQCGACVKACPMGVDIRQGFQIECINCGRCIDACTHRQQRGDSGLIGYRRGDGTSGLRPGYKSVMMAATVLILAAALVWGVCNRRDASFAVRRIVTGVPELLPDGSRVRVWQAVIGNRRQLPASFSIQIPSVSGTILSGAVNDIRVQPNESVTVTFSLRTPPDSERSPGRFELRLTRAGESVARAWIPYD